MIEIKHKTSNAILFKSETAIKIKIAVEEAVKNGIYLRDANLRNADLRNADLRDADLSDADLLYCKMTKKVFKQITEELFKWDVVD